jgi:phosphoribosylanthranilate isomerase
MTRVRVKICCIGSAGEALTALAAGASAIGLVSSMPSGPGVISESQIAEITASVPAATDRFLLTSRRDAAGISEQLARLSPSTVQIVDHPEQGTHVQLAHQFPHIKRVQVIHVIGPQSISEAVAYARQADILLLDSGNPALKTKELGGTGRTHNWEISREICRQVSIPVYLAGGLNPDNVATAIRQVRPYGVDVCSGVRTGGALDQEKLRAFIDAVDSVA